VVVAVLRSRIDPVGAELGTGDGAGTSARGCTDARRITNAAGSRAEFAESWAKPSNGITVGEEARRADATGGAAAPNAGAAGDTRPG
jgi:hypothetical protein